MKNVPEKIGLFLKAAPENIRKGIEVAVADSGRRVSCLLTDAFLWFAAEIAEEIGVRWVPIWPGGPHSMCAHLYTDSIRETIGLAGNFEQKKNALKILKYNYFFYYIFRKIFILPLITTDIHVISFF